MTANPAWPEIKAALREHEAAANRPDLVARVFRIKLNALLEKLLREHVLGAVIAYTWVIEFQKRGLPHAHLLLIVRSADSRGRRMTSMAGSARSSLIPLPQSSASS